MMDSELFKPVLEGISINLTVQAGCSQNKIVGLHDNRLKLKVAAKAIDGAANEAVCVLLAKYFAVPKSSINIIRGAVSRKKTVLVKGNQASLALLADKLMSSDKPDIV